MVVVMVVYVFQLDIKVIARMTWWEDGVELLEAELTGATKVDFANGRVATLDEATSSQTHKQDPHGAEVTRGRAAVRKAC